MGQHNHLSIHKLFEYIQEIYNGRKLDQNSVSWKLLFDGDFN